MHRSDDSCDIDAGTISFRWLEALGFDPEAIPAGKVYLSSQASSMVDAMDAILAGVSAGLAFYRPDYGGVYTGRNLEYLGLASGKISTFCRYGVPTIMNEIGLYSDLARERCFGLVAGDPKDIGDLLPAFADPSWGENARRFYETHLDFANYRDSVWEKLTDAEKKFKQFYTGPYAIVYSPQDLSEVMSYWDDQQIETVPIGIPY